MIAVFALLGVLGLFASLADWRRGVLIAIVVGYIQDPIRKLLPGHPFELVVAVAVFFVATLAGAIARGAKISLRPINAWYPVLQAPVTLFAALVIIQGFITMLRTHSVILAGIGWLSYFAPFLALLVGFYYAHGIADVHRWVRLYLFFSLLVTGSVFLNYAGVNWQIFQSVGVEVVYNPAGGLVRMMNGIMRTSEVAAWHIAAGICLLSSMAIASRSNAKRSLAGFAILAMLAAVFLTGRRKMLAEIIIYVSVYGFLLFYFRRGAAKLALMALVVAGGTFFASEFLIAGTRDISLEHYLGRGTSVFEAAPERLSGVGFDALKWVYREDGFFGSGAGTGAQGAQYFGGGVSLVGGAAEGGLGRVMAELGVPGLLLMLWVGIATGRYVWRIATVLRRAPPEYSRLGYGLIAFLGANVPVFITAHQVYGDPFVLIILGLALGSVIAMPRMAELQTATGATPAGSPPPLAPRRNAGATYDSA